MRKAPLGGGCATRGRGGKCTPDKAAARLSPPLLAGGLFPSKAPLWQRGSRSAAALSELSAEQCRGARRKNAVLLLSLLLIFLRAGSVAPRLDRRGGGVVEIITVCHCRCYKSFMDDVIT